MVERCEHVFEDTLLVFTGAARTRSCRKCERIEVMLASTGDWVHIEAYLESRMANRSAPP
jgi:hypothetical protein